MSFKCLVRAIVAVNPQYVEVKLVNSRFLHYIIIFTNKTLIKRNALQTFNKLEIVLT